MCSIEWLCFWWPWVTPNPQTTPFFAFFVAFHIFVVSKHRHFIFGVQVDSSSPSRRTTNRLWNGRGYVTWHVLNFGCPIHISGMAEARALKLCTKEDYIKSGQRDDKSPLKGRGFAHVTHFCMHSCGVRNIFSLLFGEPLSTMSRSTDCCISEVRRLRPRTSHAKA